MGSKTYFQYQKDLNLPIYIGVELQSFESGLADFLKSIQFTKLSEKEELNAIQILKENNASRCLNLSLAGPVSMRQIQTNMEYDSYGTETVIPKFGYQVYRYKNVGLMVYSLGVKEWELGCFIDFGSSNVAEKKVAARTVIHRFLSWSLAHYGILGLWGVTVDEGMVLQRIHESRGEAVFIDILGSRIISLDGIKNMGPVFKVLRLDPTLKGRNIHMSKEELYSCMSSYCSYLNYTGLSVPVRQMIQTLVRMSQGLIHPKESFRPRTDLSL